MDPKRITRFKFAPRGPIKIALANQFGEDYELDVSYNILKLVDLGVQDENGLPALEAHLAVTYTSYPRANVPEDAPVGQPKLVKFVPEYPGPARITFNDLVGFVRQVDLTPVVSKIEDIGSRDAMRRSQFGVHLSVHYSYIEEDVTNVGVPRPAPQIKVSGG